MWQLHEKPIRNSGNKRLNNEAMNPVVVQKLAKGAKSVLSNKYVLLGLLVIVLVLFFKNRIKRAFRAIKEESFDANETKDVNQIAQQYRSASNPSGFSWMIDFDGTDEDSIRNLAFQTKGAFERVSQAYNDKFDETLTDRMRNELDTESFQNWKSIID